MTDQEKIKDKARELRNLARIVRHNGLEMSAGNLVRIATELEALATAPTQPEPERDIAAPFIMVVEHLDNAWKVYKGSKPEEETEPAAQVIGYMIGLLMNETERARAALERK